MRCNCQNLEIRVVMFEWSLVSGSLAVNAINGNALIEFKNQCAGTPGVIGLGKFVAKAGGEIFGVVVGFVGFFVAAVRGIHVGEHGLAVDGLVKGLGGAGAVRDFGGIFLVVL